MMSICSVILCEALLYIFDVACFFIIVIVSLFSCRNLLGSICLFLLKLLSLF